MDVDLDRADLERRLRQEQTMRFVVCKFCGYHMEPSKTVDGLCVNAARCQGRVNERARHKAAVKGRRK